MFKQKLKTPTTIRRVSLLAILAVVMMASFVALFSRGNTAHAVTSSTINFQARLLTAAGAVVPDGNYNVEFKLYTALTSSGSSQGSCSGDSNCVWVETRTSGNTVRVVNGYLTVNLGSVTAFSSTINWDQEMWLGMNIGGSSVSPSWDGEMTPRLKLTAVPYAFRAGTLIGGTGSNTTTLDTGTPSGNNTIHLPAASGTVCLQSSAACGFALSSGSGNYIQNGTGIQTAANFAIQSAGTGSVVGVLQGANGQTADLFDVQTWNGTSATNVFSVNNVGAITLNGTGTTNFTTPQSSSVPTKINIPLYDPGSFGQIVAMGVPSSAQATARVISLFDARTSTHQPTIAVFNTSENDAVGFSWNGTSTANIQTIDYTGAGSSSAVTLRSGSTASGNGSSGAVTVQSGSIAGGAGGYTSGDVILQSGNAAGTTANSGNVKIDVGTATGTKGTISIGTVNAATINVGKSGATTTVTGTLNQLTGTYSLQGNGASSLTTTSGNALTITSGNTATWSTTSGSLTLQSVDANNNIVINGSSATMTLNTGASGTITVGSSNTTTVNIGAQTNNVRTINVGYPSSTQAQTINIGATAGTGATSIYSGSGSITLTSTGSTVVKQSGTATATAFQVQNTGGTSTYFDVDAANGRIGVGTAAPGRTVDIAATNNGTNTLPLLVRNSGTGDTGLELQSTSQNFYMGIDATDSQFKISSAASANGTTTQGDTTQEASNDFNSNGEQATKFVASASGNVNSISVYITSLDATPGNRLIQVGLYSDNGSGTSPNALLGSSSSQTAVVGWNTISLTGASITSGTTYWLAMSENGANHFAVATAGGTTAYHTSSGYPLTNPFASNTGNSAQKMSIYATVALAGGSDNFGGTNLFTLSDSGASIFKTSTNNTTAFQIQNASSTSVFDADTTNGRIGIGTTAPAYTLDVAGDTNIGSTNSYRIGGTAICTSAGCTPASGSSYYIQNQYATTQLANAKIQTTSDTVNTMTIVATANQNNGTNQSDLLEFQSSSGGLMAGVTPLGTIWSAPVANLAGVPTTARMFVQANSTSSNSVVIRTSALGTGVSSDASPLRIQNKDGTIDTFTVGGDGAINSRSLTNSATAFQIQNASNAQMFAISTVNGSVLQNFTSTTAASGNTISLTNASGTNTDGLLVNRNATGGTTTNGVDITNTAGTLTNGLSFNGTIGTDINRTTGLLTLKGGSGTAVNSSLTVGAATTPNRTLDVTVSNTTTNALPVLVEQGSTGDAGLEIKNTTANWYAGLDTSDSSAFKINSLFAANNTVGGFDSIPANQDTGDAGSVTASQFTAGQSGNVTQLFAYVGAVAASPNNLGQMALYADNGSNHPGTLLAQSNTPALTANSWNTFTISSTAVTSGTKYWVAYNASDSAGSGNNDLYADWDQGRSFFISRTFASGFPNPPGTGSSFTGTYAMYATITASGTPADTWTTAVLKLTQSGAMQLQNVQNSTTAFQVLTDAGASIFSVDTQNGAVRIGGTSATQAYNRLYFGDGANISIGEWSADDSDAMALYGNNGIHLSTSGLTDALTIASGGKVGIGGFGTGATEALSVLGNFNVSNNISLSASGAKDYRFRTSGSALDMEGGGADLYFSVWNNAQMRAGTDTQNTYIRMYSASSRMDVSSTYTYFNPTTTSGDVIDVNRSSAGTLIGFALSGTIQGSISVSGTTVSYNAFTGSHYALADNSNIDRSMLVSMTGNNQRRDPNDMTSEPYYGITKTAQANDPSVLGSFLGIVDPSKPLSMDNPDQVMSVGNGDMWVDDEGGNVQPGDYLISSNLAGYAMKDTGNFAESNIVARASDGVDWSRDTQTAVINGHKVKRISVLFTEFTRLNATGLAMGLASGGIVSNDVNFNGLVTFNKAVTFKDDASFMGHIKVGDDTAGTVKIPAGQTSVDVTFKTPYDQPPKITTGASDFVDVVVGNKTKNGFTVKIQSARADDLYVDWSALGGS